MTMTPDVALITGCGSGIGKALAINLHKRARKSGGREYYVYATDYREDALQDLADMGISIAKMDVTDMPNVLEVVAEIIKKHGHIDLLVCNAGIATGGFLAELDYDKVERCFDVNVHGVFKTVQAVAPHMMARRSGKIATMCSVISYFSQPFQAAYSGTKGAVDRITESLAMELEPFGVTVTSIVPGWVQSDIGANNPTDYERYETPDSFYHTVIGKIRSYAKRAVGSGMPTAQAAGDIAKGLSKKKPSRWLYTGHSVLEVLFHGIIQNLLLNRVSSYVSILTSGMGPLWKENMQKKRQLEAAKAEGEQPLPTMNGKHHVSKSDLEEEVPLVLRKEE